MVIGLDQNGKVLMVGEPKSTMPVLWNGIEIIFVELTAGQEKEYSTLDPQRVGAIFDGGKFFAIPAGPSPVPDPVVTLSQLNAALLAAGLPPAPSAKSPS